MVFLEHTILVMCIRRKFQSLKQFLVHFLSLNEDKVSHLGQHAVCMCLCVIPFQFLNHLIDFYDIWYKSYAIGAQFIGILFNFLHTVMVNAQTYEIGVLQSRATHSMVLK